MPEFDSPPVIETVLGVEFKPLERWGIPHFGLFWERVRKDFPQYAVHAALPSQIESFNQTSAQPVANIELVEAPEIRCWFFHTDEERLIQVQRDRFVHNWRKKGDHAYPKYKAIRPRFESNWEVFCGFLMSQGLGVPDVVQCEVTYINHIEIDRGWKSMADLASILPAWSDERSNGFLPTPETVQLAASFLMPEDRGRLRIMLGPAIRTVDLRQVLQLTVTARGSPESSMTEAILDWLDLGHEWVVRGFADFTSKKMHSLWKRRR